MMQSHTYDVHHSIDIEPRHQEDLAADHSNDGEATRMFHRQAKKPRVQALYFCSVLY